MKTRRLQTVSFIFSGVLFEFTGVVGIETSYPWRGEVAIGLRCMVSQEGDIINDNEFYRLEEIVNKEYCLLSIERNENKDGSITYFFSTSIITSSDILSLEDSKEYYAKKRGWSKEQVEDALDQYL